MSTRTQITYITCIFVTSNIRRLNSKALRTNWFKTHLGHCDFGDKRVHTVCTVCSVLACSREASRENTTSTDVRGLAKTLCADTGFHCNWADFQKAQITYCHKGETRLGMGLSLKTCAAQDEGVNYMGGGLAVSGPRLGLDWFFTFSIKWMMDFRVIYFFGL